MNKTLRAATLAIAAGLHLSRSTVETHLKRVYAKLAIDGRHQLHLLRPTPDG